MSTATNQEERQPWTLQGLLAELAAYGDDPALLAVRGEDVTTWTFADLADQASRLAGGLLRDGVKPGEPVFLMGQPSPDWIIVRLALGAMGALAVPCDHLSGAEEVQSQLGDCGCRWAFIDSAFVDMLCGLEGGADLKLHLLDEPAQDDARQDGLLSWRALRTNERASLPPLDSEAPAVLLYTSGTTGRPKSFTLSSANIGANVEGLVAERLVGANDRVMLPLPLHHVYPFVVGLLVPLASGAAVILPEGVAGSQIVQALRRGDASAIVGVPRLYAAVVANLEAQFTARGRLPALVFKGLLNLSIWLRRRFGWRAGRLLFRPILARIGPRLRLLVSGGAVFDEALIWQLEGLGWTVRNGYGLAETASTFTGNLPRREKIGSEGRPFQGGEVRIADPNEEGIGEIQLRGPNVFEGYRDNPESNREAFTGDGWFRTGDLGYLDDDGYLYFKGRSKEMIVLGGAKNVFPEELEKAYGASPFIEEIAVLERGGALHALVRPDTEAIRQSGTPRIEDSLRVALGSVAQSLPSYQRLAGYAVVQQPLPRTRLGKYRRFLLPDLYEKARSRRAAPESETLSAEDRACLEQPLAREVWQLLERRYPQASLSLDGSLQLDLGIDSLEWITLGLELERRVGIQLNEAELAEVYTVRDLIEAVQQASKRPAEAETQKDVSSALLEARRQWTRPDHLGHDLLAALLFAINWGLMKALFRLRCQGLDKLPPPGRFIIVANHASDLDPLVLAAALPYRVMRRIYWGGDVARLFSGPLRRFICRALHIFPVDERAPSASLAMAEAVLRRGDALIWFPESWRSPDGELQTFLPGIGSLIESSSATAVPAYIGGTFQAMPRWARLPRLRPVSVTFGDPLTVAQLGEGAGDTSAQRITRNLQDAVADLAAKN